jgi:hypothetical protein
VAKLRDPARSSAAWLTQAWFVDCPPTRSDATYGLAGETPGASTVSLRPPAFSVACANSGVCSA